MADLYRPGDFYRQCDRCGFKVRASATKKEWTGLITCEPCWDSRHPQDFVRGKVDRQNVNDPRPEATDTFRATPVTQDDL